ncbi:MAG: NYN domain-containing protein [Phycisphaerales bacterium]
MPTEPVKKRVCAFVDGQNLFHAAKEAFGYRYPNYDISKLVARVCNSQGWSVSQVCFYTGIPDERDDTFWHRFWSAKLSAMGRQGVRVFTRPLRYRNQTVSLPDGTQHTILVGQEKGIDIRIALDVVHYVRRDLCDVALVLSQDQDLSEVATEVRSLASEHSRWVKIACAYPDSPTQRNRRGINSTDWIRIDRSTYDQCIDSTDYRPRSSRE